MHLPLVHIVLIKWTNNNNLSKQFFDVLLQFPCEWRSDQNDKIASIWFSLAFCYSVRIKDRPEKAQTGQPWTNSSQSVNDWTRDRCFTHNCFPGTLNFTQHSTTSSNLMMMVNNVGQNCIIGTFCPSFLPLSSKTILFSILCHSSVKLRLNFILNRSSALLCSPYDMVQE